MSQKSSVLQPAKSVSQVLTPDRRQRELEYQAAFPQSREAPTPEQTSVATSALTEGLSKKAELFRSVQEEGGGAFFQQNRLLYLPTEQVTRTTSQLANAERTIGALAKDPSLRGLALTLSFGLIPLP